MTNDLELKNTTSVPQKKTKKKRAASLDKRKARAGWWFVMPFVLGFFIVYIPIIFDSLVYSFSTVEYTDFGPVTHFVGFENYSYALFSDPDFAQTLVTGMQELLFDIPAIILFSLFMAVLLNQKMVGRAAFRAIFFVPVIVSTGLFETINSSNLMEESMESVDGIASGTGSSAASQIVSAVDIALLFQSMKVGTGLVLYVTEMINNIYDIVNRSGVQMLIFLAGLQSISPAIYESCQIDGATGWETFWKITFPMISPMILVNAVYTVIDSFTTNSNTVMRFISQTYNTQKELSAAMSWIYFSLIILIIAVVAGLCSAFVFYQRRD
ncbi:MAG: sugar ABC transporter permease [Clostridia bacterium]|nr:sugar ABC transporter permease [Clostridia bacterium]